MVKPLTAIDLQKVKRLMDNWKLQPSRMIMNKKDYEDILAFDTFECPACGVSCNRAIGHPDNGCDLGKIYNIMED